MKYKKYSTGCDEKYINNNGIKLYPYYGDYLLCI